jgi:hypothetical protein
MLFQAVIGACLESPEDFCVCPLRQAVAPGMSHIRKAELGADALVIHLACQMSERKLFGSVVECTHPNPKMRMGP